MIPRSVVGLAICLLLLALCAVGTARADSRLQSYVIAGGGGESAGGDFRLHGTIAQPAVAMLSSGGFRLQGGFWPGDALPSAMHPLYLPLVLKQ